MSHIRRDTCHPPVDVDFTSYSTYHYYFTSDLYGTIDLEICRLVLTVVEVAGEHCPFNLRDGHAVAGLAIYKPYQHVSGPGTKR